MKDRERKARRDEDERGTRKIYEFTVKGNDKRRNARKEDKYETRERREIQTEIVDGDGKQYRKVRLRV